LLYSFLLLLLLKIRLLLQLLRRLLLSSRWLAWVHGKLLAGPTAVLLLLCCCHCVNSINTICATQGSNSTVTTSSSTSAV
jgi:hypothetical protein